MSAAATSVSARPARVFTFAPVFARTRDDGLSWLSTEAESSGVGSSACDGFGAGVEVSGVLVLSDPLGSEIVDSVGVSVDSAIVGV